MRSVSGLTGWGLFVAGCHLVAVGEVEIAQCEDLGHRCLLEPAAGWEGPFYVLTGEDGEAPASCPEASQEAQLLGQGLTASGDPARACDCTFPPEACSFDLILVSPNCFQFGNPTPLSANTCAFVSGEASRFARFATDETARGTCVAEGLPPALSWQTRYRLCEHTPIDAACADGACASSAPTSAEVCIRQVGDNPCPTDGAYPVRRVVYEGWSDGRSCACGSAPDLCTGDVQTFDSEKSCRDGLLLQTFSTTTCTQIETAFSFITVRDVQTPTCDAPEEGALEGEARPTQRVTLCCAEPSG